jgi:hypothetical protein
MTTEEARTTEVSIIKTGKGRYGWMPHNAGFGFLDIARATLGQIHF